MPGPCMPPAETQYRADPHPTDCSRSDGTRLESALRRLTSMEAELWLAVGLVMLGDVVLTLYGLGLGLSEANPLAVAVLDVVGAPGLVALKVAVLAVGGIGTWVLPDGTSGIVPLGLLLPTLAAVVVNLVHIAAVGPA